MSHETVCKFSIRDKGALAEAAEACGLRLEENTGEYRTFGGTRKAQHKLAAPGATWEVGVDFNESTGEYSLKYDLWNGGNGLLKLVGDELNKLKQQYSLAVTRKQLNKLKRQGFRVREVQEGGKIKLVASR